MKYMVIGKRNAVQMPLEYGAVLFQAAKDVTDEAIAAGRMDCAYSYADSGGFAISNADSPEDMQRRLLNHPLYPFFDWEVKSLCNYRVTYDNCVELMQRLNNLTMAGVK